MSSGILTGGRENKVSCGRLAPHRMASSRFHGIKPVWALDLFHDQLDPIRRDVLRCKQRKQQRRCRLRQSIMMEDTNYDQLTTGNLPGMPRNKHYLHDQRQHKTITTNKRSWIQELSAWRKDNRTWSRRNQMPWLYIQRTMPGLWNWSSISV